MLTKAALHRTTPQTYGEDNAYYSDQYSYINEVEETEANKSLLDTYKEFTKMNITNAITGGSGCTLCECVKAEAYMLQHAIVIPCNYQIGWSLSKVDNDTKMNAMYGLLTIDEKLGKQCRWLHL